MRISRTEFYSANLYKARNNKKNFQNQNSTPNTTNFSSQNKKRAALDAALISLVLGLYAGTKVHSPIPQNLTPAYDEGENARGTITYTSSDIFSPYYSLLSHAERLKFNEIIDTTLSIKDRQGERISDIWNNFDELYGITKDMSSIALNKDVPFPRADVVSYYNLYNNYSPMAEIASGDLSAVDKVQTQEDAVNLLDDLISNATTSGLEHSEINSSTTVNTGELGIIYRVLDIFDEKSDEIKLVSEAYRKAIDEESMNALRFKTLNDFVSRINNDEDGSYAKFIIARYDELMEASEAFDSAFKAYEDAKTSYGLNPSDENFVAAYKAHANVAYAFNGYIDILGLENFEEDPSKMMDEDYLRTAREKARYSLGLEPYDKWFSGQISFKGKYTVPEKAAIGVLSAAALVGGFFAGKELPKAPTAEPYGVNWEVKKSDNVEKIEEIEETVQLIKTHKEAFEDDLANVFLAILSKVDTEEIDGFNGSGLIAEGEEGILAIDREYTDILKLYKGDMGALQEVKTPKEAIDFIDEIVDKSTHLEVMDYFRISGAHYVNKTEAVVIKRVLKELNNTNDLNMRRVIEIYNEEIAAAIAETEEEKNINNFETRLENDKNGAYKKFLLASYDEIMEHATTVENSKGAWEFEKTRFLRLEHPTEQDIASLYSAYLSYHCEYLNLMELCDLDNTNEDPTIIIFSDKFEDAIKRAKERCKEEGLY